MIIADCSHVTDTAIGTNQTVIRHGKTREGVEYSYEDQKVLCEMCWWEYEQGGQEL